LLSYHKTAGHRMYTNLLETVLSCLPDNTLSTMLDTKDKICHIIDVGIGLVKLPRDNPDM